MQWKCIILLKSDRETCKHGKSVISHSFMLHYVPCFTVFYCFCSRILICFWCCMILEFGVTWDGLCFIFMSNNKRAWHELTWDLRKYDHVHIKNTWTPQNDTKLYFHRLGKQQNIFRRNIIKSYRNKADVRSSTRSVKGPWPASSRPFPEQIYGSVLICIMDFRVNCPFKVTFPPLSSVIHYTHAFPLRSNMTWCAVTSRDYEPPAKINSVVFDSAASCRRGSSSRLQPIILLHPPSAGRRMRTACPSISLPLLFVLLSVSVTC